jgi:hypothetical protein
MQKRELESELTRQSERHTAEVEERYFLHREISITGFGKDSLIPVSRGDI